MSQTTTEASPLGEFLANGRSAPRPETTEWVQVLTTRTRNVLELALLQGDIPDLTQRTVKMAGQRFWLRRPNFGRISLRELTEVFGEMPERGLDAFAPEALRAEIRQLRARLSDLEAALDARLSRP